MTATLTRDACTLCKGLTHHGSLSFLAIKATLRGYTNTRTSYWWILQLHNVCHTCLHSEKITTVQRHTL
jgi:hypothetical protein